jgi:hypothetical protein
LELMGDRAVGDRFVAKRWGTASRCPYGVGWMDWFSGGFYDSGDR